MSETQTLTLAEFLLARIAEDEAVAQHWPETEVQPGTVDTMGHPLHWPRRRMLAECEAKRRIIDLRRRLEHPRGGLLGPNKADAATAQTLVDVLKLMAIPYADHPDFREEWK